MAWGSVAAGVVAVIMMFAGLIFSLVPVLGTVLSFGAPVVAIAGVVMGGVGLSRAKRDGQESGAAIAGLIVSIIAFFPAVVVALTCGMCNACFTAGMVNPQNRRLFRDGGPFRYHPRPSLSGDAGKPPAFDPTFDPGAAPDPTAPRAPDPGYPPPAFPPPPVPDAPSTATGPGPGGSAGPPGAPADDSAPNPSGAAQPGAP